MTFDFFLLFFIVSAVLVTWFVTRASVRLQYEKKLQAAYSDSARLEGRIEALKDAEEKMIDKFNSMSSEVMSKSSDQFLKLATTHFNTEQEKAKAELRDKHLRFDQLVDPIRQSLALVDEKLGDLEKRRIGAYEGLVAQVKSLLESQHKLELETSQLGKALRSSNARGQWGELQLKRVVEAAGMVDRCDFFEQSSIETEKGKLRPDMLIKLPGDRNVIVDSKVPLSSYLEAFETDDLDKRQVLLKNHAQKLKDHIKQLSSKTYWESLDNTPEFVVMFIPNERVFSESVKIMPELFDKSVEQKVIISTPTTLIAMLKSIAYAWKQDGVAENAKHVNDLGKVLYKRLVDFSGHLSEVGKGLQSALSSYNKAVGSYESRLVVSAKRMEELELDESQKKVRDISLIEDQVRLLKADID